MASRNGDQNDPPRQTRSRKSTQKVIENEQTARVREFANAMREKQAAEKSVRATTRVTLGSIASGNQVSRTLLLLLRR